MYSWVCLTFWISILKITSQRKIIRSNPINSSPLLISCSSAVAVLWLQPSETLTKEAENRKQVQFPKAIEPSSSHRRAGWEDAPGCGVSLTNDVFHWNFEEKKKKKQKFPPVSFSFHPAQTRVPLTWWLSFTVPTMHQQYKAFSSFSSNSPRPKLSVFVCLCARVWAHVCAPFYAHTGGAQLQVSSSTILLLIFLSV